MDRNWADVELTLRKSTDEVNALMREFAGLWVPTRLVGEGLGWRVSPGAVIELYFQHNRPSMAENVFVSPYKPERFLFRATPKYGLQERVRSALSRAADTLRSPPEVYDAKVARVAWSEKVVEVVTTRREVLGAGVITEAQAKERLKGFVEPLLRALQATA